MRAQVFTAVQEHERIFGGKPKGMWVPECAYYPGLDDVLAEAGIRYFLVDSHGIDHAEPRPLFGVSAPLYTPSGVAAFGRHPLTSKLVWSTNVGYPADYNYREYYRDIGFELDQEYLEPFQYAKGIRTHTGIKYHRITGKSEQQAPVQPRLGARDRRRSTRATSPPLPRSGLPRRGGMPFPCVIVSPYDAELFGHWWFEGPQWIYYVMRELSGGGDLALGTPGEYLAAIPIQQKAMPAPSSWGKNGYTSTGSTRRPTGCGGRCTRRPRGCGRRCSGHPRRSARQPGGSRCCARPAAS